MGDTSTLPTSPYAPLQLPHEVELFGRSFRVRISTGFTFSPDTLMRVVSDRSLESVLRKHAPGYHLSLRKLAYAGTGKGKHQLREGTKKLLLKEFEDLFEPTLLRRALGGEVVPQERTSDWLFVLKGLGDDAGVLTDASRCLAAVDAYNLELVAGIEDPKRRVAAEQHLQWLFAQEFLAWRELDWPVSAQTFILTEVLLKTLAWLEWTMQLRSQQPSRPLSRIEALWGRGKRPLGHWLQEVCRASGCRNLGELSRRLLAHGAKHKRRPVSHELLRNWSSSRRKLMPHEAIAPVLSLVKSERQHNLLRSRWYVARLMTFAVSFVCASTYGSRGTWERVQQHLASRHEAALKLQCGFIPP